MMLFSGKAIQLHINRGSDAIIADFEKAGASRINYRDGGGEVVAKREAIRRCPSLKITLIEAST